MNPPDFKTAIRVHSVEEERAHVRGTPCGKCGAPHAMLGQALLQDPATGKHYDAIRGVCAGCGAERPFLFDISSFFGRGSLESAALQPSGKLSGAWAGAIACTFFFLVFGWGLLAQVGAKADWLSLAVCLVLSIAFFVGGPVAIYRLLARPEPPPSTSREGGDQAFARVQSEIDTQRGHTSMEERLGRHGIPLDGPATDPSSALTSGVAKATISKGIDHLEARRYAEAIEAFGLAMGRVSGRIETPFRELLAATLVLRATAYRELQKTDEAKADFRSALEAQPDNARARKGLAEMGER